MVMHIGWVLQKHVKEPNLEYRLDIKSKKLILFISDIKILQCASCYNIVNHYQNSN